MHHLIEFVSLFTQYLDLETVQKPSQKHFDKNSIASQTRIFSWVVMIVPFYHDHSVFTYFDTVLRERNLTPGIKHLKILPQTGICLVNPYRQSFF